MNDRPIPTRGCVLAMGTFEGLREAASLGIIWTASQPVIVAAVKLMATGELPVPPNIPPVWASYLASLRASPPRNQDK